MGLVPKKRGLESLPAPSTMPTQQEAGSLQGCGEPSPEPSQHSGTVISDSQPPGLWEAHLWLTSSLWRSVVTAEWLRHSHRLGTCLDWGPYSELHA